MDLPESFSKRMKKLLGEAEYNEYIESFQSTRMYGLRVNTRKISAEEFEKMSPFEIKKIPWVPNGYYYNGTKDSPAKHPYYHAGLYYLQEPSAMTPASIMPVEEGDYVLDLCAAPGGKATELGAKLNGTGLLVANDISNSRAKGLLKNLELAGIDNLIVTNETPDRLLANFPEFFDKILIDAPCSGEGMFRKDPAIMKSWVKKGPDDFAAIQREIVTTAVKMLKPGGFMLYSTCTFSPEENEGTMEFLLNENPDMEIVTVEGYEGFSHGRPEWLPACNHEEELKRCIRIWPHRMEGEGHFITLLHRKGDKQPKDMILSKNSNNYDKNDDFEEFKQILSYPLEANSISMYQDRLYRMPPGSKQAQGLHFLRSGLLLGECRKKRFEPSQALAMAVRMNECSRTICLKSDDLRVIRYLKGETLDVSDCVSMEDAGWHLICVDGFPLGWGKVGRGILKNKYHAGWRWM